MESFHEIFINFDKSIELFASYMNSALPPMMQTLNFDQYDNKIMIVKQIPMTMKSFVSYNIDDYRIKGVRIDFNGPFVDEFVRSSLGIHYSIDCQGTLIFHSDDYSKTQPTLRWESISDIREGLLPWIKQVVIPQAIDSGSWNRENMFQSWTDKVRDEAKTTTPTADREKSHLLH